MQRNGINYNGIEKDVVILLQSMVDQGILDRRYVIPAAQKKGSSIETFFVFAQKK